MLLSSKVTRIRLVAIGSVLLLAFAACGGGDSSDDPVDTETASPAQVATATAVPPTEPPAAPTATPTARPNPTPTATAAPVPTATATAVPPSPTPVPTATPVPLVWSLDAVVIALTGDGSFTPTPGTKAIFVTASFSGLASDAAEVPTDWFLLRETNGPEFPAVAFKVSASDSGDGGTGTVVFEVPATATRFELVFRPAAGEGPELISGLLQP